MADIEKTREEIKFLNDELTSLSSKFKEGLNQMNQINHPKKQLKHLVRILVKQQSFLKEVLEDKMSLLKK